MRTIYKYPVTVGEPTTLILPLGAKIVDFNAQGRGLFIWALVQTVAGPNEIPVTSTFRVFATGEEISKDYHYRHTCHADGFVWHLFERM